MMKRGKVKTPRRTAMHRRAPPRLEAPRPADFPGFKPEKHPHPAKRETPTGTAFPHGADVRPC